MAVSATKGGQMPAFAHRSSLLQRFLLLFSPLPLIRLAKILLEFRVDVRITSTLHRSSFARFGCAVRRTVATTIQTRFQRLALNSFLLLQRLSRSAAFSGSGMRGALAVEYAFCMLIIAVMMSGVQELFWDMAQGIVNNFNDWVSKPYP